MKRRKLKQRRRTLWDNAENVAETYLKNLKSLSKPLQFLESEGRKLIKDPIAGKYFTETRLAELMAYRAADYDQELDVKEGGSDNNVQLAQDPPRGEVLKLLQQQRQRKQRTEIGQVQPGGDS